MTEAFAFIASRQTQLLHSPLIEEEAFYRIRNYPEAISEQFHQAMIYVPRIIAYILHQKPEFASPAIDAFYLRDAISLQIFDDSKASRLKFPPTDLVKSSIRFTRVGFAQLKGQQFQPPECWIPQADKYKDAELERLNNGMKLTCGFEMLLYDKQNQNKQSFREIQILLDDLDNGDDSLPTDQEMQSWSKVDDDEKWMDINFEDFDKELSGKPGSDTLGEGFGDKAAQENLRRMVARFENFLNDDRAGLDGANMDDSDSEEDSEDSDEELEEDEVVSFDEDEFEQMMNEMMGLPPGPAAKAVASRNPRTARSDTAQEDAQLVEDMEAIEAELKETGVLDLNRNSKKSKAITASTEAHAMENDESEEDEEDQDVDVDLTLAKNMLEAFKSQGGAAGPAGNLMGLLNVHFPPDKDD
jgi:SGT1 protein